MAVDCAEGGLSAHVSVPGVGGADRVGESRSRLPLPVLVRDIAVQASMASPLPAITLIIPAAGQPAATLNTTRHGTRKPSDRSNSSVVLSNSLRGINQTLAPTVLSDIALTFMPPDLGTPAELAAGIYDLSVQVPWGLTSTTTNSLPFAIAPEILAGAPRRTGFGQHHCHGALHDHSCDRASRCSSSSATSRPGRPVHRRRRIRLRSPIPTCSRRAEPCRCGCASTGSTAPSST